MTGRTHRIPRGPRSVLGSALCAAATCASLFALTGLIVRGSWLLATWLIVLVVAAVVVGVRAVTRSWWAPTLAGTLVALGIILVRYGAPPGRLQVIPDTGSFERTLATAREGVAVINASLVPMAGVRPAELLVVVGAVAVFLLSDLVAIGLGLPALSGVAFAALWVPAIILGFPASGWAIGWTAFLYLLLLALSAAPASAHTDRARRISVAILCSVTLIVATLLAGPAVAAFPGWASMSMPSFGSGPVGPMSLSDNLDLRESLGSRSGQVVLRYSVNAPATDPQAGATPSPSASATSVSASAVGPLRAFTLTSFDGRAWDRADSVDMVAWDPATLLSSDPALRGTTPDADLGTLADVQVEVAGLRERRLPVSTFPRTVNVPGTWEYDPGRDEVVGRRGTFDGMTYSMTVQIPSLTADDLADAQVGDPGDDGASLEVPETSHSQDIADLAKEITADATTPYQQAMALQTYFRATSNFTYDTRVAPSRSDDAVWDFLQSTRGYCVQFSTSMTIMARTLGIPARVGVGFLPGQSDRNGAYVVTGHESHAWPELFFEGYGWVRFEPTPAVQSGSPPQWSDPFRGVSAPAGQPDDVLPTSRPAPSTSSAPGGQSNNGSSADAGRGWLPVAITVAIVLAVASFGLAVVRRRTRFLADLTPERAWLRARRKLAARGVTWSDSETPRTVVLSVQEQLRQASGSSLTGEHEAALESLARTVERERYAPQQPDVSPAVLAGWVDQMMSGVETLLSDRSRRGAVPSAPRDGS
ncbi:transglutaminase TgpA family protein [Cellulomonas sp. ICMP 17802]|uniref:transglutaminase TgpA family protein n=1 Tax=Cellulomonas sp. ICMP 17802 TaxID=3239199 RepID=UPI00351AEFBD